MIPVVTDIIDCADVRMIQRGNRAALTVEAHTCLRIVTQVAQDQLEGHRAVQPRVLRPIHCAHAAGAKLADDLIGAKPRSRQQDHVGYQTGTLIVKHRRCRGVAGQAAAQTGIGEYVLIISFS
jgi:hypothetical protein